MVDWGCCTMVSFSWSRCQMCYSVVNNYLSAGRNRFDLESGPWTIRATRGKETLYPVPIKFAHWRLKSTWICPIVMSRLVGTCVADDAYLVQTRDISYFVATWWRGWFILVRHSNKKRDNVAKSRPGSNTDSPLIFLRSRNQPNIARTFRLGSIHFSRSKCSQSHSYASICIILTCTDVWWLNECICAVKIKLKYVKII